MPLDDDEFSHPRRNPNQGEWLERINDDTDWFDDQTLYLLHEQAQADGFEEMEAGEVTLGGGRRAGKEHTRSRTSVIFQSADSPPKLAKFRIGSSGYRISVLVDDCNTPTIDEFNRVERTGSFDTPVYSTAAQSYMADMRSGKISIQEAGQTQAGNSLFDTLKLKLRNLFGGSDPGKK